MKVYLLYGRGEGKPLEDGYKFRIKSNTNI